jgi:GST-like protein
MAAQPQPIDVYYWPTPNGWKITIMLEEVGLPYNVIPINIGKGDQFKPEFLAISPNNKMPAIVDHGRARRAAYLGVRIGRDPAVSRPQDRAVLSLGRAVRGRGRQWLFWQMGGFGPMLGQTHHFRIYAPERSLRHRPLHQRDEPALRRAEQAPGGPPFVAGEYSIADMAIVSWAKLWERQGQNFDDFPHASAGSTPLPRAPPVQRGLQVNSQDRSTTNLQDPAVQKVLFGQRAR